ncbi:MAG: molybdopterin cofactor-binding domain-containing protein, partial [Pseudomonadota bacterium]
GSSSTPDRWLVLRQVGANVRGLMLKAASQKFSKSVSELKTENGFVINPGSGEKISYNELAQGITAQDIEDQPLKNPKDFKLIGKKVQKVDALAKSTGTAEFGIDFKTEGMLKAVVLRCPTFGGKYQSHAENGALKVPGIKQLLPIHSGLAIVGEKYWQLAKAREMVKVTWDLGDNKDLSSEKIQERYAKALRNESGKVVHDEGDFEKALKKADLDDILDVEYSLPYLSHSPMEPMNAAASVTKEKADVWVATQCPTLVQGISADFLGLAREDVSVHTTKYLGGGFGRRSTLDYPLEAVELSQKMKTPVQVIWSREDDTQFSPMRPINRHRMRAIVKDKKPLAWEHRLACESIMQQVMPGWLPTMIPGWVPGFLREGVGSVADVAMDLLNVNMTTAEGAEIQYDLPHTKVSLHNDDLTVPIHFWRSVGHSYNGFVVESFVDEVAHKMKMDPYEFRKTRMKGHPRGLKVLNTVAEMAGWGQPLPEGRARGMAYCYSFQTYVAQVAEVEIKDQTVKVKKVYCAADCGTVVNPNIVEDQLQSGIIYGLSAALGGQITLKNGGVAQSNFHDYTVQRMNEAPEIIVKMIESNEAPTGIGEPGLPPIAAAVGNAIFALNGKRLRNLPFEVS